MVGVTSASPFLSGIVKAVPSGDTVIVMKQGPAITGPPPEMKLSLSSIRAPILSRDGQSDEPHAFPSREALRKRLIGRTVSFRIDYRVASLQQRSFATIYPNATASTISVNIDMVECGHCRVRKPINSNEDFSPELEQLLNAEERAMNSNIGLHNSTNMDNDIVIPPRNLPNVENLNYILNGDQLVNSCKGHVLSGIVEYVSTGSIMKVFVRNVPISSDFNSRKTDRLLTLSLTGIQAPGFRRQIINNTTNVNTNTNATGDTTNNNDNANPQPQQPSQPQPPQQQQQQVTMKPMPYAANARFLTEIRLLHRDVKITLEGVDRNDILLANVEDPQSKMYIGEELLKTGMAKTLSWSLDKSSNSSSLRAAEQFAKNKRLGLWKGFQSPALMSNDGHERFIGKVIEIVSGDMLSILDDRTGKIRRIGLASVRASRIDKTLLNNNNLNQTKNRSTMPVGPAADAKEALRQKIIGKKVHVKIEYTREPLPDSLRKERMTFGTICKESTPQQQQQQTTSSNFDLSLDIALPMISSGLLSVVRHRGEEDRAGNYEEYLEREADAVSGKRGMHANNAVNSNVRINNLTGIDAKKRSKDILSGLQRGGPYKGIIEYVTSASRYRIYLKGESMLITLALRAVRCPQATRRSYAPDGTITDESAGEAHGDEALDFARERIMQREVEVEIMNVDRVGAFLGNIWVSSCNQNENLDVSELLLKSGFGYLHESFDASRDRLGSLYTSFEKEARNSKRGVWLDYVEPVYNDNENENGIESGNLNENGNNNINTNNKNNTNRSTNSNNSNKNNSTNSSKGGNTSAGSIKKRIKGVVCEIGFGGRLFIQESKTSDKALANIEQGLSVMKLNSGGGIPVKTNELKPGDIVVAKFSADNRWYRARINFVHRNENKADVRFMDYGNEEKIEINNENIRKFSPTNELLKINPIAFEFNLAFVVIPGIDDPNGMAAGEMLRDWIYGREIEILVFGTEGGGNNIKLLGDILVDENDNSEENNTTKGSSSSSAPASASASNNNKLSLREEMLKCGLARIVRKKKDRASREAFKGLREFEEIGIKSRQFFWTYGEAFESDCDDEQ